MVDQEPILSVRGLTRHHQLGEHVLRALDGVDLDVRPGTCTAIVGPSGSGKSTLLGCLGLVDRPDAGTIELDGVDITRGSEIQRSRARRSRIGIVFQQFHLMPHLTAIENAILPTVFHAAGRRGAVERGRALLERVGLGGRLHHRPRQLSGGEQQRVAIARALINSPGILLADEPTANLDSQTAAGVVSLLRELAAGSLAVVLVTHDQDLAAGVDGVWHMRDGRFREQARK
jgi:ABC-type lipoprotein export system ATPase subunit